MRIGTVYTDTLRYRDPFYTTILFLLSGLRSYVEHRCIALLYRIPLGNFNCVLCSTHQIPPSAAAD